MCLRFLCTAFVLLAVCWAEETPEEISSCLQHQTKKISSECPDLGDLGCKARNLAIDVRFIGFIVRDEQSLVSNRWWLFPYRNQGLQPFKNQGGPMGGFSQHPFLRFDEWWYGGEKIVNRETKSWKLSQLFWKTVCVSTARGKWVLFSSRKIGLFHGRSDGIGLANSKVPVFEGNRGWILDGALSRIRAAKKGLLPGMSFWSAGGVTSLGSMSRLRALARHIYIYLWGLYLIFISL